MRSLTRDVYSLLQVRTHQYKNIQNTDADAWELMPREITGPNPMLRPSVS